LSREKAVQLQTKILELNNQSKYFDLEGDRVEPKSRVKDAFPDVNNLIELDLLKTFVTDTFFDGKDNLVKKQVDHIRKEKLEFSISIDGLGRQEFIKMNIGRKQEEEEERQKDIVEKLADMIG
jgi:hypothetical protein